jgi:hypothetical protein
MREVESDASSPSCIVVEAVEPTELTEPTEPADTTLTSFGAAQRSRPPQSITVTNIADAHRTATPANGNIPGKRDTRSNKSKRGADCRCGECMMCVIDDGEFHIAQAPAGENTEGLMLWTNTAFRTS